MGSADAIATLSGALRTDSCKRRLADTGGAGEQGQAQAIVARAERTIELRCLTIASNESVAVLHYVT
jgi:hypothetical protein